MYPTSNVDTVRIQFDKKGKLSKITKMDGYEAWPSLLAKDTLYIDINQINKPNTDLFVGLESLNNRLHRLKKDGLSNEFYEQSYPWPERSLASVRNKILAELNDLIAKKDTLTRTNKQIALSYSDNNEYLPLQLSSDDTGPKIIFSQYDHLGNVDISEDSMVFVNHDINRLEYKIVQKQLDNEIVSKHLAKTKDLYNGIKNTYKNLLPSIARSYSAKGFIIDQALIVDTLLGRSWSNNFNIKIIRAIEDIPLQSDLIQSIYKQTYLDNEEWIKSWLWYTGGEIKLNPFDKTDPEPLIKQINTELYLLDEELKSYRSGNNQRVDTDELPHLINRIQELKALNDSLVSSGSKYKEWLKKISVKEKVLYSGEWHISSSNKIRWFRHYNITNDNRLMAISEDDKPNMVAKTDELLTYTHNVKAGEKISLTSERKDFQPKSPLEEDTKLVADQFDSATKGLGEVLLKVVGSLLPSFYAPAAAAGIDSVVAMRMSEGLYKTSRDSITVNRSRNPLNNWLFELKLDKFYDVSFDQFYLYAPYLTKVLLKKNDSKSKAILKIIEKLKYTSRAEFVRILYDDLDISDKLDYEILINDYKKDQAVLAWLLSQTQPLLQLNLKPDETPVYSTSANYPERKLDLTESSKITYKLYRNDGKEPEIEGSYNKYKQIRVLPTVGIGFIPKSRTGLIFDESTGQFSSDKRIDNIEAFVGVKYYPFFWPKTNPVRQHSTSKFIRTSVGYWANYKRGNTLINTIFFTGGFGVRQSFLRNYYVGIGFDIVPGINVHTGYNILFQKWYNLENNKIINQQERPNGYYYIALSFDPGIVKNIANIFK